MLHSNKNRILYCENDIMNIPQDKNDLHLITWICLYVGYIFCMYKYYRIYLICRLNNLTRLYYF